MRTVAGSILIFIGSGLAGPLLRWATWPSNPAPQGSGFSFDNLIYDLVLFLWPTQPLAVMEVTIGSFAATSLSVGANALLFGIVGALAAAIARDRKSTRLNSSHGSISYAVFCLKKKKNKISEYRGYCRRIGEWWVLEE